LREDFLRQRGQTEEGFDPFIEGGIQGQEFLREGSTAEGFNKFLEQITGGELFQSLRDEQLKTAQGQAAAGGQTVTGETLRFLSQLPPQLALQLEGELFGRNRDLAERGFRGVERRAQLGNQLTLGQGQLSSGLVDLESRLRDRVSGRAQSNITGIGRGRESGTLADEQIDQQRIGNLINLVGTVGSFGTGGNLPKFSSTTQRGNRRSTTNFF